MSARSIDKAAWPRLSPLLDELLDLDEPARSQRLAALRAQDTLLAGDLHDLLERLRPLDAAQFLAAPALPPPVGLAGQTVGAYRLEREIGQGGMGSVWLAQRADGRYQAQVAIKFMRGGWLGRDAAERFQREGQLLARLDHPHIARLLDAGVMPADGSAAGAAGQPYLVLDYVDGQPIDRWCDAQALDLKARVRLLLPVLAAVAHAHSRRVLHRDLKPSNILVTADGTPKLLDFGVGKLLADAQAGLAHSPYRPAAETTLFTHAAFTARYAAPEQVQQQPVTTATDVYAMGVLLYGLLGGGHPTEPADGTPLAQMQALVDAVPARLSDAVRRHGGRVAARDARALQGGMDAIVAMALHKDPAARYANAAALADDLRRWLDQEPVHAGHGSAGTPIGQRMGHQLRHLMRRHLPAVAAVSRSGTLARAGAAMRAAWAGRQARSQPAQAAALMDFMLGDLQQKLAHLGRPDLLQSVGERALAHYANDDLKALDAPALARRAQALRMIGESAQQRLDVAQARTAFEQAANTTGRLLALAPDDIQRLQDHATSLERMVYLIYRTLDNKAALALCRQVSALRWRAAARAPQDPALQLQAIYSDHWAVPTMMSCGMVSENLALLTRIQAALQSMPPEMDSMPRAWSVTLALMGQALHAAGRYAEAADKLRAFLALQPAQHNAVADVTERGENLAVARTLAQVLLSQGQPGPAAELARQAAASADSDADQSPDNLLLAERAIRHRTLLAEALWLDSGEPAAREAHVQLEHIDARLARLGEIPADNTAWHLRTLGEVLALRARLQPQAFQGADPACMVGLQAHAGHVARLDAQGCGLHSHELQVVLAVGLAHGDALLAQGQPAAAAQRWQAVVDRALPAATEGLHRAMQHLALALLRLGQPQPARPWVERLQASTWRHPDLADLQQRLVDAEQAERGPALVRAQ